MTYNTFISHLRILNSQPELLEETSPDSAQAIVKLLQKIQLGLDIPENDVTPLVEEFNNLWLQIESLPEEEKLPEFRGMFPKFETNPPRQILNDSVVMTLQRLEI